jgi:hypothetical protein
MINAELSIREKLGFPGLVRSGDLKAQTFTDSSGKISQG